MYWLLFELFFFFSSRRRHTRSLCDWSSDVCSSDLPFVSTYGSLSVSRDSARSRKSEEGGNSLPSKNLLPVSASSRFLLSPLISPCRVRKIGRASCRERVWMWEVVGTLKKKTTDLMS